MPERWTVDQVLALATTPAARTTARRLSSAEAWDGRGADDVLVWGVCTDSATKPTRSVVDLSGPEFHCSCSARSAPCKHALALLLSWAEGQVSIAEPADFARTWKSERDRSARRRADARAEAERLEARAKRQATNRRRRTDKAFVELDGWFDQQVRAGLARTDGARVAEIAERMDAGKLPGVADRLRALDIDGERAADPRRIARLLAGFARLHTLGRAHAELDTLDADLAASVLRYTDHPVDEADAFATEGVEDTWVVLGQRFEVLGPRTTREVAILRGQHTKRLARIAAISRNYDGGFPYDMRVGKSAHAALHFYPARVPLDAQLSPWGAEYSSARRPSTTSVSTMLAHWASLLVADPWLPGWPVVVRGTPTRAEGRWWLVEPDTSHALPFQHSGPWRFTLEAAQSPLIVMGLWDGIRLDVFNEWPVMATAAS